MFNFLLLYIEYFIDDPKPIVDGARINSPHYLCKLIVTEPGIQRYTLVVAQVFFSYDILLF